MDLAVDAVLPYPAGDQLSELTAEIENEDGLVPGGRGLGSRVGCLHYGMVPHREGLWKSGGVDTRCSGATGVPPHRLAIGPSLQ